ncbi:MAG: hypothetical protein ABIW03_00910 [Sphingomicrobium sp.]
MLDRASLRAPLSTGSPPASTKSVRRLAVGFGRSSTKAAPTPPLDRAEAGISGPCTACSSPAAIRKHRKG